MARHRHASHGYQAIRRWPGSATGPEQCHHAQATRNKTPSLHKIRKAMSTPLLLGATVQVGWATGHSGTAGNDLADTTKLSTIFSLPRHAATRAVQMKPAASYLLGHPNWTAQNWSSAYG